MYRIIIYMIPNTVFRGLQFASELACQVELYQMFQFFPQTSSLSIIWFKKYKAVYGFLCSHTYLQLCSFLLKLLQFHEVLVHLVMQDPK